VELTSPKVVVAVSAKFTVVTPVLVLVDPLEVVVGVGTAPEVDSAPIWIARALRAETVAVKVPEEDTVNLGRFLLESHRFPRVQRTMSLCKNHPKRDQRQHHSMFQQVRMC